MKYVVGNWKAHKDYGEAEKWVEEFRSYDFKGLEGKVEIIICPPTPFLSLLKEKTKDFPFIKIGSQDISEFDEGAYTGEVVSKNLDQIIDYCLIGHSERRRNFGETDQILFKKVEQALKFNIYPLFCIRGAGDPLPGKSPFIVFEPVEAIGTGKNESVDSVLSVKKTLSLQKSSKFIYGGSVTEKNASIYLDHDEIDGVLPGGASLNPLQFYKICTSS